MDVKVCAPVLHPRHRSVLLTLRPFSPLPPRCADKSFVQSTSPCDDMSVLTEAFTSTACVAFLSVIVIGAVIYSISAIRWRRRSHGRPLPPGPKALPFIGNVAHMAKPEVWRAHTELFKQYGECSACSIVRAHVPRTSLLPRRCCVSPRPRGQYRHTRK